MGSEASDHKKSTCSQKTRICGFIRNSFLPLAFYSTMTLHELLDVRPPKSAIVGMLKSYLDGKAKPPGSLGKIEDIALQIGTIQQSLRPAIKKPVLLVFAADHGIISSGVTTHSTPDTASMAETMLKGHASANAFAAVAGVKVKVVDAGLSRDVPNLPDLIGQKVGYGTRDATLEPAMTATEVETAILRGAAIAHRAIQDGADMILLGEIGIGNSSSASLIVHRLSRAPLHLCVGPGSGHTEESMSVKRQMLDKAAARSTATQPLEVLSQFGGYEIAMMTGAAIAAAKAGVPLVVDGFICAAAILAAIHLAPATRSFCLFSHLSTEPGHAIAMTSLNAEPLLHLDMRLGEGTGALLAVPLVKAACALLSDVASLEEVTDRVA